MRKGRVISLSEEEYHDIFRKFGVDRREGAHAMDGKNGVRLIDISKLKPLLAMQRFTEKRPSRT